MICLAFGHLYGRIEVLDSKVFVYTCFTGEAVLVVTQAVEFPNMPKTIYIEN